MPTNKRITDLTDYTSILPYASEMFGVYQPLIGWKSKRISKRLSQRLINSPDSVLKEYSKNYIGASDTNLSKPDCSAIITSIEIGKPPSPQLLLKDSQSVLVQCLAKSLPNDTVPHEEEWKNFVNEDKIREYLSTTVSEFYKSLYGRICRTVHMVFKLQEEHLDKVLDAQIATITQRINGESAIAGALLGFLEQNLFSTLESIFYKRPDRDSEIKSQLITDMLNTDNPFATFDPKKDIKNVSLSPLGIVHLFRQYFFELDTFLGTPTGHVWLSPGSMVELIEVSTRRVYIEKIIEQSSETTQKTEQSTTHHDEISEAVKEDNKTDLKLGASVTVNQSWGTGNATATGSLNMEHTQDTARETTHKRMREQTGKLSTEIRQSYKSTFKTITETTDTSSKRYVLNNTTQDLINYELRRKMRQVGVQVQDIGTYLCWETFVDEPGRQLGLANLVNIAKPADIGAVPAPTHIDYPPEVDVPFTTTLTWDFTNNNRQFNGPDGFLSLKDAVPVPQGPQDYEVSFPDSYITVGQISATGEDFSGVWGFKGKLIGSSLMTIGPWIGPGGVAWDNVINFVVGGVVRFKPNQAMRKRIDDANIASIAAGTSATIENERKTKEAFLKAAKERIELASNINTRKYEDLREEERIIVYRNLIGALMYENFYLYKNSPSDLLQLMPESHENDEKRHILSELINSVFDIDKMLYFVAPEWWKPRRHFHQTLGGGQNNYDVFTGNLTSWSDLEIRPDNYFITENSRYAKLGSSLGWLLQLDGDNLRNAFLNAPWVKAVIPIRPGKELEAINWLQQMHVEGTDGLENHYDVSDNVSDDELEKIRIASKVTDVTIGDAIKYLGAEVALKHKASLEVGRYPKEEINDDNRVSATPINKVYEHGFYSLKDGFRAVTSENYEVFDQWIEVLPTDQVVPVEVKYDPKTGRQIQGDR